MARYSGRYYRGASRDMRERKRIEAETRDALRHFKPRHMLGADTHGTVDDLPAFLDGMREVGERALTGINGYPLRNATS